VPVREVLSSKEQLDLWVAGECVHFRFGEDSAAYHCTPDFACCMPELLADQRVRVVFAAADERRRSRFLTAFLAKLVEAKELQGVHIIGG